MQTVRVIIADTEMLNLDAASVLSRIAPRYAEKYRSTKLTEEAEQELWAGFLLKEYLNVTDDAQLRTNQYGKPYLTAEKPFFSLSHSGRYVVLAISDSEIGVDIEALRAYHEATAQRVFPEKTYLALQKLESPEKDAAFSRLWTECEAAVKLRGTGFPDTWDQVKRSGEGCSFAGRRIDNYFLSCAADAEISLSVEEVLPVLNGQQGCRICNKTRS